MIKIDNNNPKEKLKKKRVESRKKKVFYSLLLLAHSVTINSPCTTTHSSVSSLLSSSSSKTKQNLNPFASFQMDDYKRSHIPAFGNWDYEDGLPITQYFESARQAGLLRYTYGEGDLYSYSAATGYYDQQDDTDLYLKPTNTTIAVLPCRKIKGSEEDDYSYVKEPKKQGRIYDVTLTSSTQQAHIAPKAVDEDLYKISPELLYTNHKKRKTFGGFFNKVYNASVCCMNMKWKKMDLI